MTQARSWVSHAGQGAATERIDLSIVIVSWNTRELLRRCLDSILRSKSWIRTEVFVVDNASEDGSAALVGCSFPSVRLIRNDVNRGFATANNQALRICRGRYVLLLNSDTEVLGSVLSDSVAYMDAHPDVGILGCRVLNEDGTVQRTCFQYPSLTNLFLKSTGLFRLSWPKFLGREHLSGWARDSERDVEVVTGCFMLVRREAMEQVGALDEHFFFCGEETDWCKRFRGKGWTLRFAPVGEIVHVGNASGRQLDYRRDLHLWAGLVRLHGKHGGRLPAVAAWFLLLIFCATRVLYWSTIGALGDRQRARERRWYLCKALANFRDAWPKDDRILSRGDERP